MLVPVADNPASLHSFAHAKEPPWPVLPPCPVNPAIGAGLRFRDLCPPLAPHSPPALARPSCPGPGLGDLRPHIRARRTLFVRHGKGARDRYVPLGA